MNPQEIISTPITFTILEHTGNQDGDDGKSQILGIGYRDVDVDPADQTDPDPLVPVGLRAVLPYNVGPVPGLCYYYGPINGQPAGLGGPSQALSRKPFNELLERANLLLGVEFGLELVVVDAFRPWWVQVNLWRWLFHYLCQNMGLRFEDLTPELIVKIGNDANNVGSYCSLKQNNQYRTAVSMASLFPDAGTAAQNLELSVEEFCSLFVTYLVNLKIEIDLVSGLEIEEGAITAHGNGGAADLWLYKDGKPAQMLVPFDYMPLPGTKINPAIMNYAELVTWEEYAEVVKQDPILQAYQRDLGVEEITPEVFEEGKRNRRILFHVLSTMLGCTVYSADLFYGECWHFNGHNRFGGKQSVYLVSGNGCQALLRNTQHPDTGRITCVWDNGVAHHLAREHFGITYQP